MSEDDDEKRLFEEALARRELRGLPGDWRQAVVGNALVGAAGDPADDSAGRVPGLSELWARLFPQPVVVSLAAAWVIILGLWVTIPRGEVVSERSASTFETEEGRDERLVAWVEERRRLLEMEVGLFAGLPFEPERERR
jgi:hypothetical protein